MSILVITVINLGLFFLLLIIHIPTHCTFVGKLIWNTTSYLCYTGAYSQTMVIHSFCNVDDVSWGTKGSVGSGVKKYEVDKVFFVSSWLFYNCLLAFIFIYVDVIIPESSDVNGSRNGSVMLIIIAFWGTLTILLKSMFAMYYHFKWVLCEKCCLELTSTSEESRKDLIDKYWQKTKQKVDEGKVNFHDPSMIIRKKK
jgi:chitin synthase